MIIRTSFANTAKLCLGIVLIILMLGAYTRLSDAGLGCPDWPGCYGNVTVPASESEFAAARKLYPDKPLDVTKAWIEMSHRYAAGILGLLVLYMTVVAIRLKTAKAIDLNSFILSVLVLSLVVLQAVLGMLTVTKLVKPTIVTMHLLGGMLIMATLWLLHLKLKHQSGQSRFIERGVKLRTMAIIAVVLIFIQIALGGWVSTNYAALACIEFPGCYVDRFFPQINTADAFNLRLVDGINYEGGIFDSNTRATIHMLHRIGALIVTVFCSLLAAIAFKNKNLVISRQAVFLVLALSVQVGLGISNVYFSLPLPVAVLHNGMAAILLLAPISIAYYAKAR